MNELEFWEVNDILDNIEYTDRNSWEQCKINSYITAQVNSTKKINIDEFMKFKWNDKKEEEEEHNYEITNSEIERLKKLAQTFEKDGKHN